MTSHYCDKSSSRYNLSIGRLACEQQQQGEQQSRVDEIRVRVDDSGELWGICVDMCVHMCVHMCVDM